MVTAIGVSRDGRSDGFVYSTEFVNDHTRAPARLIYFARESALGELRVDGCMTPRPSARCMAVRALDGPRSLAFSPDDSSLYVGGVFDLGSQSEVGEVALVGRR